MQYGLDFVQQAHVSQLIADCLHASRNAGSPSAPVLLFLPGRHAPRAHTRLFGGAGGAGGPLVPVYRREAGGVWVTVPANILHALILDDPRRLLRLLNIHNAKGECS
jgi:hypothetical protein